jgi:predicted dehydrogenase
VDWDKFRGPAPMIPFSKNHFLYNWHWFWDTGNGDIGNQGVHEMDIARWGLGVGLPRSVVASGGKYVYDDDQETPNTLLARFDYGDKELVFEVRGLQTGGEGELVTGRDGNTVGNLFYGDEGWMSLDGNGYRLFKGDPAKLVESVKAEDDSLAAHLANFLSAARTRKYQDLHAEVDIGRLSAGLCHLANISYRLGGSQLKFDAQKERFESDEANRLAHPAYRAPYTIPNLA